MNRISLELDLGSIAQAAAVEADRSQPVADQGAADRQVLDMEEIEALAEHLRLMVFLDAEALARMAAPQALFQDRENVFFGHRGPRGGANRPPPASYFGVRST